MKMPMKPKAPAVKKPGKTMPKAAMAKPMMPKMPGAPKGNPFAKKGK